MSPEQYAGLLNDLEAELADFEAVVSELAPEEWQLPTPATGWTVGDQVSHVAEFNDVAALALTDADAFGATRERFLGLGDDWVDALAWGHRDRTTAELADWLSASSAHVIELLRATSPDVRMVWFGPDMSAASCATARLMETWAHGQDVLDTLGLTRTPTSRLAHICHLGVITRGFSFRVRGLEPQAQPVRVELFDQDGDVRSWGPDDAVDRVEGSMLDFALVVTRRRHVDETGLVCAGAAADWLAVAQAYAGGPGGPRGELASYALAPGTGVSGAR